MSSVVDCPGAAGAYLTGALDEAETVAFEQHLARCEVCRGELELLESAMAAVPLMVTQHPGPVMVRDEQPATDLPTARAAGRGNSPDRAHSPGHAGIPGTRVRPTMPLFGAGRRLLVKPVPRPALAGIGALLVAAVATVAISRGPTGVHYLPAQTAWQGAEAAIRVDGDHGALLVKGVPAAPAGDVYEIWIERRAAPPVPTSARLALLSGGEAEVAIPGSLPGVSEVFVTAEPAGGSAQPTGDPVILAKLP